MLGVEGIYKEVFGIAPGGVCNPEEEGRLLRENG